MLLTYHTGFFCEKDFKQNTFTLLVNNCNLKMFINFIR